MSKRALKEENKEEVVLHFSITDSGIGLSHKQQEKLFQSFRQADSSTTRRYGGTGLGLAISKKITQQMGGEIWVESKENIGSSFHFTVHLKKQLDNIPRGEEATQNKEDKIKKSIEALRGTKILLVEDNTLNQELAKALLKKKGVTIVTANNGEEALKLLANHSFDGILMDCQMPVMDGYEATRQIRCQEKFKDLPIIAMTANAMKGDKDKVLAVGMNDHIAKPIVPNVMFMTVAKWIKTKTI